MFLHILIMSLIIGLPIPFFKLFERCCNIDVIDCISCLILLVSYVASLVFIVLFIINACSSIPALIISISIVSIGIIITTFTSKQFVNYLTENNEDLTESSTIFLYINFIIISIFSPFIFITIYVIKHICINNIFYRIYVNAISKKDNNND